MTLLRDLVQEYARTQGDLHARIAQLEAQLPPQAAAEVPHQCVASERQICLVCVTDAALAMIGELARQATEVSAQIAMARARAGVVQ